MKHDKPKENITHHSQSKNNKPKCNSTRPISYFKPIIENEQLNQLKTLTKLLINPNASDAMPHFYHSKPQIDCKDNKEKVSSSIKRRPHFDSNKIAMKEMTILKKRQLNGLYMEALINKSIDLTAIPNTTLLSKSLLDLSMIQAKKDCLGSHHKQSLMMSPMYTSGGKDLIVNGSNSIEGNGYDAKSSVGFTYRLSERNKEAMEIDDRDMKIRRVMKACGNKDNSCKGKDKECEEEHMKMPMMMMKRNDKKGDGKKTLIVDDDDDVAFDEIEDKEEELNGITPIKHNKTEIIFEPQSKVESNSKNHYDIEPEKEFPPLQYDQINNIKFNIPIYRSPKKKETLELTDQHLYISNHTHNDINQFPNLNNDDDEPNNLPLTTPILSNAKPENAEDAEEESENYFNIQQDINYQEKSNRIYLYKPITTFNDIQVKNWTKTKDPCQQYHLLIKKYFDNQTIHPTTLPNHHHHDHYSSSSSIDISPRCQTQISISNASYIDKDSKEIEELKEYMIQISQHFLSQINHIQYDITKLEQAKIAMDESIENKVSSTSLPMLSKQETLRNYMMKIEKINTAMNEKEKNDKKTIKNLLSEFKALKQGSNTDQEDKALIREANDFIDDDDDEDEDFSMKFRRKQEKLNSNGSSNSNDNGNRHTTSTINHMKFTKGEQDSKKIYANLLAELTAFKNEEPLYKFEIPSKYNMPTSVKCLKEKPIKGKLVRFYDNAVVDIIDKKKTVRRIFPDLFEIWYYNNDDKQMKLSGNRLFFSYNKNKSYEFRFLNDNFLVYKFPSGQYEKHYFDNAKCIKFADGSYRITRPNGEELIQLSDGTIHYSTKKGNKIIPKVQEGA